MGSIAANDMDNSVLSTEKSDNKELFNELLVYPNPAIDRIHVGFFLEMDAEITVRIYNMKGELISWQQDSFLSGSNLKTYDLSRFSEGVYILRISSSEYVETKRIVIQ
jgi:hypothetical protein